jgi:hypothetical protein
MLGPICGRCDEDLMPDGHSRYIQLMALAGEWAQESGTPPEMVLRRLCEWAVAGGFPDGAFVTSAGERISPLDLLTAVRVVIGNGQATIGNCIIYMAPSMAGHQLAGALLTVNNVLKFCAHTNTLPPPSVLGRLKRFLAARDRGKRVAPPECSDADEHAARQCAYRGAIGGLNSLRKIISRLKGENPRYGPRYAGDETVDFDYWGSKWTETRDRVQEDIRRCSDSVLQKDLDTLDLEWREFVTSTSAQAEASAKERRVGTIRAPLRQSPATRGEIAANNEPTCKEPRLRIVKAARRARFDSSDLKLSPRSFNLLIILAEEAIQGAVPVETRILENKLLAGNFYEKAIGQAIDRLKREMNSSGVERENAQSLIENIRAVGYRLRLSASDIQIDD